MKGVSIRKAVYVLSGVVLRARPSTIISGAPVCLACGCSSYQQPGDTAAEGQRRHERVARINQQELTSDIDTFFLADKMIS